MLLQNRLSGWTNERSISSKSLSRSLAQVHGASGIVVRSYVPVKTSRLPPCWATLLPLALMSPKERSDSVLPFCDVSGRGRTRNSMTSQARSLGPRGLRGIGWYDSSRSPGKVTAWPRRYLGHSGSEKVSGKQTFNERTISKGQRRLSPELPAAPGLSFPKR
ncbi:uncharacterized protein LOC110299972 [Mus caroli]|uniref:Uncharacterized protein LOC110299972 n=1 Tax=Mus caroli TaxID=10089 RepID=A0A6P5Q987_MUSCR|nr:uncharacterized protein LOC110299972 [Mus caroli]